MIREQPSGRSVSDLQVLQRSSLSSSAHIKHLREDFTLNDSILESLGNVLERAKLRPHLNLPLESVEAF